MIIKIRPQAPYNFELSTLIFSNGDPQIQKYENGIYWQVINLNKHLILIEVQSVGSVDKPELSINIKPDNELSKQDIELVKDKVTSIFNLNYNLKEFYNYMKDENVISKLILKLKGLNSPTTPTFFEAIVTSIIEQQISLKAARSIETKMIKKYGEKLRIKNETFYGFPTPENLSKLKKEDLRGVGLSFRKAEYVIGLSKSIEKEEVDLNNLKTQETTEIIQQLIKIRGIGVWTAELAVIRGLHKLVALPADDIGIRRVVSNYYKTDKQVTSNELRTIAKNWGKWSGLVVFYLIIADLMSIKI